MMEKTITDAFNWDNIARFAKIFKYRESPSLALGFDRGGVPGWAPCGESFPGVKKIFDKCAYLGYNRKRGVVYELAGYLLFWRRLIGNCSDNVHRGIDWHRFTSISDLKTAWCHGQKTCLFRRERGLSSLFGLFAAF
jgi:hypothetical protein